MTEPLRGLAGLGIDEPAKKPGVDRRHRIFLVDDSGVVRTLMARWIEAEPDLVLVGVASDGAEAIRALGRAEADVCVLDLEMPVLGGLDALPRLLELRPNMKVLVCSRLSQRGAEVTLRALQAGAADYLSKPAAGDRSAADNFRRDLVAKARMLARSRGRAAKLDALRPSTPANPRTRPALAAPCRPEILALGASTGGPNALSSFLKALNGEWQTPIVIVQHMPKVFLDMFAAQLEKASPFKAICATHGMRLEKGRIYLAPGDVHLKIARDGTDFVAQHDTGPAENYCRPAVDVLFRSVAAVCGTASLGVVFTGMGRDGCQGADAIVKAGGLVLAQDEASSVVWGMPGAVVDAGLAEFVGPADALAAAVKSIGAGRRP